MIRIVAKISLYDILAMVVPGSIFLMGLGMIDCIYDKALMMKFVDPYSPEGHAFCVYV